MTLKAAELDDVVREVGRVLSGRAVQKVVQPDEATVVLGLRGGWFLLSADARAGRVHLADGKPAGTGEAAPAFCMLLRKELIGLPLAEARTVPGERAAELTFAFADRVRHLRLLLFGASAQLQLVDGSDGRILSAIGPGRAQHSPLPPPREASAQRRFPADRPSAAIAEHYAGAAAEAVRAQAEAQRRAAIKKQERLMAALEKDLARATASVDQRKWGDLLLAHLAAVPRGASVVALPDDFTDGSPLEIPLDPAMSARDNAARYYKQHKRMSRARAAIEQRLGEATALRDRLARGETVIAQPRQKARSGKSGRGKAERPPPYREFRAASGMPILVGRGSDRNDELTFKVARGNDLWLHARDWAGAHVIVASDGRPVDGETLLDAATLAAHHSRARDEAQVDIIYLARKHVRKPPRAAPGLVTTSGAKTVRVRMQPDRLQRLLASRIGDER